MARQQDPPVPKYQRVPIDEEIENLEDYEPGGYHPVDLFDVLDDRFEVIYKLGFGGIAMVWLCYEFDAERWRAVKINAASHSSDNCAELKLLKVMKDNNLTTEQLDAMHIVVPLETFWINGPNGRHLCSVMPVLGPRLSQWRGDLAIDYDTIDKVCYQFTEGLGFLHGLGIAHGDFRPANILMRFKLGSLDNISVDEMKHLLDAPDMEEVLTMDDERSIHAPENVVTGVRWNRLRRLIADDIAIVDFGESYRNEDPPSSLGIPRQYGAPEVVFGGTPTIMSDIWSLAYTLMEVRLGCPLIPSLPATVWRMERFAGPVPHEYRLAAVRIVEDATGKSLQLPVEDHLTEEDNVLRPITENIETLNAMNEKLAKGTDYTCPLEIKLGAQHWVRLSPPIEKDGLWWPGDSGFHRLPPHEVTVFADLLRGMFKYVPGERLGAYKALNHPWFRKNWVVKAEAVGARANHIVYMKMIGLCLLFLWLPLIFFQINGFPWVYSTRRMSQKDLMDVCVIVSTGFYA